MRLPRFSGKTATWIKYGLGYLLFAAAVIYGLRRTPPELWRIKPGWLALSGLLALAMFAAQYIHVKIFLSFHRVSTHWLIPALFTARKGVLNALMPARTGTMVLINTLTAGTEVRWHQYLVFMLISAGAFIIVSALGVAWLALSTWLFLGAAIAAAIALWPVSRIRKVPYLSEAYRLAGIGILLFGVLVFAFYTLLEGLGHSIGLLQSAYFAVAGNAMAQLSITPGNMGVREFVMGLISPMLALPVSVGIIMGAAFFVIRLAVYSAILLVLEIMFRRSRTPAATESYSIRDRESQ